MTHKNQTSDMRQIAMKQTAKDFGEKIRPYSLPSNDDLVYWIVTTFNRNLDREKLKDWEN